MYIHMCISKSVFCEDDDQRSCQENGFFSMMICLWIFIWNFKKILIYILYLTEILRKYQPIHFIKKTVTFLYAFTNGFLNQNSVKTKIHNFHMEMVSLLCEFACAFLTSIYLKKQIKNITRKLLRCDCMRFF